jgi:hypothetical protein
MEKEMNTIKRFILSIALLIAAMFFLNSSLSAQQRQGEGAPPIPGEAQINKMVEDLSGELSLSDGQKTEILELFQDHFAEVKSSMSSGQRLSREEMESLKEEFEDEVKSLLNDNQQDLFDDYIKNNKPQQGKGRKRQQNGRK